MKPIALALAATTLLALGGCYESFEAEPQAAAPAPAAPPPTAEPVSPGVANTPRPGLSGAKRAAHNTVDEVNQRQKQLEEMMEEDQ